MQKLSSERLSNLAVLTLPRSSKNRMSQRHLVQALINHPLPPTLILSHQASGGPPAQPVTADNHGMMPRMGPRKPLTLLGESLCPWWPILGMTASSSLGTAAYSDGTWGR